MLIGYIILHTTSLGADARVATTRRYAEYMVFRIILKDIDYNDTYKKEDIVEILKLIEQKEFKKVTNLWFRMTEQTFEIKDFSVAMPDELELAKKLSEEIKHTRKYLGTRMFA